MKISFEEQKIQGVILGISISVLYKLLQISSYHFYLKKISSSIATWKGVSICEKIYLRGEINSEMGENGANRGIRKLTRTEEEVRKELID